MFTPFSGTSLFDDFENEFTTARPQSVEEELDACKKQLRTVTEKLRAASEKIRGKIWELNLPTWL